MEQSMLEKGLILEAARIPAPAGDRNVFVVRNVSTSPFCVLGYCFDSDAEQIHEIPRSGLGEFLRAIETFRGRFTMYVGPESRYQGRLDRPVSP